MVQTLQRVKEAATGLQYTSETDAPFTPVYLEEVEDITAELLQFTGKPAGTPVVTTTVAQFFQPLTTVSPESTEVQRKRANRFVALQQVLTTGLKDVQVYKVGEVKTEVFIVGKIQDSDYAGLHTYAVET